LSTGCRHLTRADGLYHGAQRSLETILENDPVYAQLDCAPHVGEFCASTDQNRRQLLELRANQSHDVHRRAVRSVRSDHDAGRQVADTGGHQPIAARGSRKDGMAAALERRGDLVAEIRIVAAERYGQILSASGHGSHSTQERAVVGGTFAVRRTLRALPVGGRQRRSGFERASLG
jgi:hypothetical protein